ncbi:MAG: PEP-CTERM sorting domain-containing protein [Lyngbya sp.]|nr:PEP-CTERM sorting domain-containing protein [Lyngbya sp.]
MTISSVLKTLSVATVAMTATVSTIAPAQALTLKGSIGLSGNAEVPAGVNPATTTLEFSNTNVQDPSFDFLQIVGTPTIADLTLTRTNIISANTAEYTSGSVQSFINFGNQTINGENGLLTFDLNDTGFFRLTSGNNFVQTVTSELLTGVFQFNGQTFAQGFLTASRAGDADTFELTLSTEVPEPFTILGSLSALGAGTLMKKQHDKRQNQVKSDA